MPIGLLTTPRPGGRDCDRLARQLLGRRASSVFTPPARPLLTATHYDEVRSHGLGVQSFHILPKIREVDALMTPALQQRVYEAHPELAFRNLAGQALLSRKKTLEGRTERLQLLGRIPSPLFSHVQPAYEAVRQRYRRVDLAPDDIVDAMVLVWTAWRIWQGRAICLPPHPVYDTRGLRMDIWY
jgi:predicted RNase H-like nuclease